MLQKDYPISQKQKRLPYLFVNQKALIRIFHKITFLNSQYENTDSRGNFNLKNWF